MYDEPYRWVEAIRHRREYLEEQISEGSPIVALPFKEGVLLATVGSGTAKLYEIYDLIAFGGIGHPADLEKLRNVVLDAAHVEGFNRSPLDVTVRRLMKFGLAPMVKQAFEEILHAPYIVKVIMTEINPVSGKPLFFRLSYDGVFEETEKGMALAANSALARRMERVLNRSGETSLLSFEKALQTALRSWAVSELPLPDEGPNGEEPAPGPEELDPVLKKSLDAGQIEVALLDRGRPGSSKYRTATQEEVKASLEGWLK